MPSSTILSRQIVTSLVAILVAMLLIHDAHFGANYLLVTTAFLMCQISVGSQLRLGFHSLILILVIVLGATYVGNILVALPGMALLCVSIVFALSQLMMMQSMHKSLFNLYFCGCFIILTLFFVPGLISVDITSLMKNILLGGLIALMSIEFFLRKPLHLIFAQGMSPLLKSLMKFSECLRDTYQVNQEKDCKQRSGSVDNSFTQMNCQQTLFANKITIENMLLDRTYPEWIYEIGFNPGLRAGFRYFLLKLEYLIDIYFSLNNAFTAELDPELRSVTYEAITETLRKNEDLMRLLHSYFTTGKIDRSLSDLISDITTLEAIVRENIPENIDLLDISNDYVILTAITRALKDARQTLIELLSALPEK